MYPAAHYCSSSILTQEVRGHGVEGVAGQLVVALDSRQQVELHAALDGDVLVLVRAVRLGRELRVAHARVAAGRRERKGRERPLVCSCSPRNPPLAVLAVHTVMQAMSKPPLMNSVLMASSFPIASPSSEFRPRPLLLSRRFLRNHTSRYRYI